METAQLNFFRYKGKRYTFKTPIELKITETPNLEEEDEEDRGEYVVENDEWGIRGSDNRSLKDAIIDAEYYFQNDYGWYLDTNIENLTIKDVKRILWVGEYYFGDIDIKRKRKEIIKNRKLTKDKLVRIIGSITEYGSAPW